MNIKRYIGTLEKMAGEREKERDRAEPGSEAWRELDDEADALRTAVDMMREAQEACDRGRMTEEELQREIVRLKKENERLHKENFWLTGDRAGRCPAPTVERREA